MRQKYASEKSGAFFNVIKFILSSKITQNIVMTNIQ